MKNLFLIATLAALLTSCSSNVDLAIDNPGDFPLIVTIDTLTVEVPPREVVWVEMGQGSHTVTLENDSTVTYNFTERMYMLNPTMSEYLKSEEFYGSDMSESQAAHVIPHQTVTFLGMPLEGNFDVIRELINPITWDCGPREELPEMVEMDADESYVVLTKIYDQTEFINLIQAANAQE